jgi:hypothetical protein
MGARPDQIHVAHEVRISHALVPLKEPAFLQAPPFCGNEKDKGRNRGIPV